MGNRRNTVGLTLDTVKALNRQKMTLKDFEDTQDCRNDNKMEVGESLKDALLLAKTQGRITCGVCQSGQVLESDPQKVMFCILPENAADDVMLQIHATLLEAFCWENDIRIMKVDSIEKLAKLLADDVTTEVPVNDNDLVSGRMNTNLAESSDFSCIVVEHPAEHDVSEAEEDILEYYKMTCDMSPQPVIDLAV